MIRDLPISAASGLASPLLAATALLALSGCATIKDTTGLQSREDHYIEQLQNSDKLEDRLTALELRSGGRLGFAMMDSAGATLASYRSQERFAMCSTFKTVLAADVLKRAELGKLPLRRRISYGQRDLLDHAPQVKSHFDAATGKGVMTVEELAKAAVVESDNSAANLLLAQIGGPKSVTDFARSQGDYVTRLDRTEPTLNENGLSDPRDSSSPAAMVWLTHRLLVGKRALRYGSRQKLTNWLVESPTGAERIRAGLPSDWKAGSKTGTCDNAYNDVAIVWDSQKRPLVMAIFLDRPTKTGADANKIIAEVAALVTGNGPASAQNSVSPKPKS